MSQEKSFKSKLWEFFKVSGKPLCFRRLVTGIHGLLLGIGSSVTSPSAISSFPFSR